MMGTVFFCYMLVWYIAMCVNHIRYALDNAKIVFFQPVELVTTCTLTMLGALEVVRAAYCAL